MINILFHIISLFLSFQLQIGTVYAREHIEAGDYIRTTVQTQEGAFLTVDDYTAPTGSQALLFTEQGEIRYIITVTDYTEKELF